MDEIDVQCPYCWEWVAIRIEADVRGAFALDCEVCCRPWQVAVYRDDEGAPDVSVQRT